MRQVQAHEAPRRGVRQVRRRGDPLQGSPRAHGTHRARQPGVPRLVLQGPAEPHRPPARPVAARPRADPLLRKLRRHRSGRHRAHRERAAQRGALPRGARRVRRRGVRSAHGRRGDQGAAVESRSRRARRRAAHRHEDRHVADPPSQGRQAPEGRRRLPQARATGRSG